MTPERQRQSWLQTLPKELREAYESAEWVMTNSVDPLAVLKAVQDWRTRGGGELMRLAVRDARKEGATWADIGEALGMSRQQAFRTWAKLISEQETNSKPS